MYLSYLPQSSALFHQSCAHVIDNPIALSEIFTEGMSEVVFGTNLR